MYANKMFISVINSIRDILRSEAIIGKQSINHCIVFLVIRLLNKSLCQKLNLDEKYAFNNLFNDGNINKSVLYEKIYNPGSQDFLILHLVSKLNMNFLKGFKVRSVENLYNILYILKDLNIRELNEKYDLIGTIYELHLKTGTNNGRDLGQYFTNRKIIEYMVKMVNPLPTDMICDPAMGTGGFLTICVKHLNKYNINWSTHKNHICGFDIDEEIINLATLNLLLETGEKFDTLYCQDALTFNIQNKFDIILTNEPMGLKTKYNLCSDKIKELNIKTSKCEPLFVQLIMQLLNPNGKACIIIPEGFLANVDKTREYLIDNFEVQKVVHLKGKFFLNTTIETYILYFINSGNKTQKVDFYVYDKDFIETKILELKYDDIVNNSYKLLYRLYNSPVYLTSDVVCYKIKDICIFLPSGKYPASYGKDSGLYPFFSASKFNKYCDNYDYDVESIIIGKGGQASINYGTKFSCANHVYVLTTKYQDVLVKYIYYYLKINLHILQNGFVGTGLKHLTREYLENIEIPIPSLEEQINIINEIHMLNDKIEKLNMYLESKVQKLSLTFDEVLNS